LSGVKTFLLSDFTHGACLGTIGFEPLISRCTDETAILAADPAYAMIYVENLAFFHPVFSFLFFRIISLLKL
jgi:hypothetical protein